jgi:hypothetical protein
LGKSSGQELEKEMKFHHFMTWVFYGALAFAGYRVVGVLDRLEDSVNELNVKMAVVIMQNAAHEKELDSHEGRLRLLEATKRPKGEGM